MIEDFGAILWLYKAAFVLETSLYHCILIQAEGSLVLAWERFLRDRFPQQDIDYRSKTNA